MSLRHGILGLLCGRELSGYDLTREFDLTLAHVWSASHSQIYPELARLAADGLIEQVGSGPRGRKVYAATAAGREEVLEWLRKPDPGRELRVESLLQGFFYWLLPAGEALELIAREKHAYVRDLETYLGYAALAEAGQWREHDELRAHRIMLELGIRYTRGLIEWADWATEEMSGGTS